jgi:FKBP-type peptidyl-prolyl cis-trans isomerase 2
LTEETAEGAKVEKGDVIRLEYELWLVIPDGKEELYDTTNEELAKKENVHNEKKIYESVPLIVGHDRTVKGLDKSLMNATVGQDYDITIQPADAAGERKPDLVELVSMREFMRDNKDEPQVGMEVMRKGKRGLITGIAAGRIRMDFNDPLAGRILKYKYKIVKKAEKLDEKVLDVIRMDYGTSDDFKLTTNENEVEIQLPEVCKYDPNWAIAKYKIVSDLRDIVGVVKVRLIEEYVKKVEEKKEEPKEEEKKEAPEEQKETEVAQPEPEKTEESAPENPE